MILSFFLVIDLRLGPAKWAICPLFYCGQAIRGPEQHFGCFVSMGYPESDIIEAVRALVQPIVRESYADGDETGQATTSGIYVTVGYDF